MKVATRLALLQWAGNPADPIALWRLLIAWITPGVREPKAKNEPQSSATPIQKSSDELLGALGELMERHPTALLGTSRLPAPKMTMKAVIKEVWRQEPKLRPQLMHAYLHLSHFQDGIGDAVLDCKLPNTKRDTDGTPDLEALREEVIDLNGPKGESLRQWTEWSKVSLAEMEILSKEWGAFESQAVSAR